jgi:predicted nucleotidyltransferase
MRDTGRTNSVNAIIHMTDGDWSMEGTPLATGTGYNISYNDITELHKVWAGNIVPVINNKYKYYDDLDGGTAAYLNQSGVPNGQKYDDSTTNWNKDQYQTTQNYATKSAWNFVNAENSNQNMSVYAKNSGLRLYGLSFVQLPQQEVRDALNNMALSTGAFYEHAPNQTRLEELYKQIAIELKNNAGVNTIMTADFDKVNVTGFAMDGDQVYDYVYHQNESTKIGWQDGKTNVTNQSDDWLADSKLDFNIGTIKVGQQWNATFRLKVKQGGLIDVFGKNSTVSFNNNNETLYLPQTFITVVPNLTVTDIGVKTITLENLMVTGEISALLPVKWNSIYTGNKTLTEKVYYRINSGPWVQFDIKTHPYPFGPNFTTTNYVNYAQLDVTKLPFGNYTIKVYATASDAPDFTIYLNNIKFGNSSRSYIKLQ